MHAVGVTSSIDQRWLNMHYNKALPIQMPTTSPDDIETVSPFDFKMPNLGKADKYMSRARGYIKPLVSGNYTFNETGDDGCELWLSTDQNSNNSQKIAYHYGKTNSTEYTKYATQTSASIHLEAGKLYCVEVRHVQDGGGDFYQVQWKTPSNATWAIVPSANLAMPCSSNQPMAAVSKQVFDFEARADYKTAKLQWISNGGLRNDFYEVQRANAAGSFEKLDIINASTADDALTTFTFTDFAPQEGENFYRIKTTYNDNAPPQYSAVKKVVFSNLTTVNVFPNPANDYIDVDLKSFEGHAVGISVYNQFGKLMSFDQVAKASAAPFRLDVSGNAAGSYLIRIQPEGKRELTKTVTKM